ncbi:MAG: hypothetical protein IT384_06860 [Deltaproteobacteria bacterium]|nr:hypothetical protein [Deltaproteobacteria bacterium]
MRLCVGGAVSCVVALSLGCSSADEISFDTDVKPVLERRCASPICHGVPPDAAASGFKLDAAKWLTFQVDAAGRITDVSAAEASCKAKINSAENPAFSSFLRKTLPAQAGGLFHWRGAVFESRDAPDYRILADWAAAVGDGTEGASEPALDPLEQRFVDTVYPILIRKGCAAATCHGDLNFGVGLFKAPAIPDTLLASRAELRTSYHDARRNLALWGDPLRSRLLTKMFPLHKGGIPHKGGNDMFFAAELEAGIEPASSPAAQAILAWIDAERAEQLGALAGASRAASALVFVGGPLPAADVFEVQPFTPGSDLYRLDAPFTGPPVNITSGAHTGPADIRDPAVSHDGRMVVFSMRTSAEDAHNIYTIGLDGSGLKKLTDDRALAANGLSIGNFSPIFGPPGGFVAGGAAPAERIYFSSTRVAERSDRADTQNADLFAMNTDGQHLERLTHTVVAEVRPTFLAVGEFFGAITYTIRRSAEGGYKGVFFRFPIDHNAAFHIQPEAHPHFGMSEPPQVFYGLRELPDGRGALTLLDEGNVWRGGQLAVLERQFAVELPEGSEGTATLPGFRHALTILTPEASRNSTSAGGLWRDPVGMPDGTIVVARAPGPIDLNRKSAAPVTELVRVSLAEDRATHRPKLAGVEVIYSNPAMAASQPVAVYARPSEDPPHPRAWDPTASTALVVHSGVQVIEAVLAQMAPSAPRPVREDLAVVRVLAPVAAAGPLSVQPVPPDETRHGAAGATNLSLSGRMPLFAAVEIAPAIDGSLAAFVPPNVPLRIVTLDSDHLAVGALQHQWYAPLPGERFPVGIPLTSFGARCSGCHGAMDGNPGTVLQPPVDAITQASITAALYQDSDRRRPADLPTVGPSTFVLVDFAKDVQPILDAKCATSACHTGAAPAGALSLTSAPTAHYTDAYESLLAPGAGSAGGYAYVDALGLRARRSYLAERIMRREYEAPRSLDGGSCPPAGSPALSPEETLTIIRWIEFGSTYVGAPP